jgi:DNA-binding transcriptional LysR family regulator
MNVLANMRMFVQVVESGSFAAAAQVSGVSPTMVAKHVAAIEQRMGARLLHRTTRRQQLSDVGRLYYERCRQALAEVALAEACASELQASPRGCLRMVSPVGFGTHSLAPALCQYMAHNPEVQVELTLDNRRPNLAESGHELGILIGAADDAGMVARPLRPYRRILAASPEYLARHGTPAHPDELAAHSCLGLSYWRHYHLWRLEGPQGARCEVAVNGRFTANQGDALCVAALNGIGIVLQPETVLATDIAAGRLVRVLPQWSLMRSPMHLVYPQDHRPSAKLRSVIDFLMDRFG